MNAPAYVVGGFVRNFFLKRQSKDIDIVCVGNGIQLAENVAALLQPSPKVVTYSRYGTAMLRFNDIEFEFDEVNHVFKLKEVNGAIFDQNKFFIKCEII